ncbi:MAG: hypothetical protein LBL24_04360 [Bacteroidales bacterium]|jgi:hypothetical protein|nr:hypothetical protein [Bacteroidales bacterium]
MSIDVNRAWDKLHARLDDEQLLGQGAKTVAIPEPEKVNDLLYPIHMDATRRPLRLGENYTKDNS